MNKLYVPLLTMIRIECYHLRRECHEIRGDCILGVLRFARIVIRHVPPSWHIFK